MTATTPLTSMAWTVDRGFGLTAHDMVLTACLEGTAWHLFGLAVCGRWDARCDQLDGRLGVYGMGRN